METITFEQLKEKVGIGLAVVICRKMLSEEFFDSLQLDDWINIYKADPEPHLLQRALNTVKESLRIEIKSPLVGTFTATGERLSSGDEKPLVRFGDHVEPDTVVCGIEAMMVQNPIKGDTSGTITEILVKHGEAVNYGQVLFKVKPEL